VASKGSWCATAAINFTVIHAEAGIHLSTSEAADAWIPASAGMTG
jgi:hypothetical protein